MRTFGPSLAAIALGVALVSPSLASAQRNGHRSTRGASVPRATNASAEPCAESCGDYSLSIVSAVLPADGPESVGPQVVTLVIENRGTAPAPVSFISVAPRNQLASARRTTIPTLAPGGRTTVQLPVETAPDGTQCISITISPAPVRDPSTAQALASATPNTDPNTERTAEPTVSVASDLSKIAELPYRPDLPPAYMAPDDGRYANTYDASRFDAIRKSDAFALLDV